MQERMVIKRNAEEQKKFRDKEEEEEMDIEKVEREK